MAISTQKAMTALEKSYFLYDPISQIVKQNSLILLSKQWPINAKNLTRLCEILLFIQAYPQDEKTLLLCQKLILKISNWLKKNKNTNDVFQDSSLPYTKITTQFSHDFTYYLWKQKDFEISIDSFDSDSISINQFLKSSIHPLLREETTAELENEDLLQLLSKNKKNQLGFLLTQAAQIDSAPYAKDQLWSSLKPWVQITGLNQEFSLLHNQIPVKSFFYHDSILKKPDAHQIIHSLLPQASMLNEAELMNLVKVIKYSMALSFRETDPISYMDIHSLKFYELDRGISIAIYGLQASRQLALQSYIGYSLFKNGLPVSYGGAWVFGEHARFGLNIFEAYRGGESAFILCQLLRVYHQVFGVKRFEIDAYMIGKDNPEGISTAAYWFYYRLGFRSIDPKIEKLASRDFLKIKENKKYKTSVKLLKQFTKSDLFLELNRVTHASRQSLISKVIETLQKTFHSDAVQADLQAQKYFVCKKEQDRNAFQEWSLVAYAMGWNQKPYQQSIQVLIDLKAKDVIQYNEKLISFLKHNIEL